MDLRLRFTFALSPFILCDKKLSENIIFLGLSVSKEKIKELQLGEFKRMWLGLMGELKAWLDTKKPISTSYLPCSLISLKMGHR